MTESETHKHFHTLSTGSRFCTECGKEITAKVDTTIESETQLTLQEIVAEVATKGMIGMQLAMGDGDPKHHEKVLKEAEQLIQDYVTQALTTVTEEKQNYCCEHGYDNPKCEGSE